MWFAIEVICYVCALFPLLKEQVQFNLFFFLRCNVEEMISPTDQSKLCTWGWNGPMNHILSQPPFHLSTPANAVHACVDSTTLWPRRESSAVQWCPPHRPPVGGAREPRTSTSHRKRGVAFFIRFLSHVSWKLVQFIN